MKNKILIYLDTIIGDYDKEEIDNIIEILENYNEELSNLTELDAKLLNRIIDDEKLSNKIENCVVKSNNSNPFG